MEHECKGTVHKVVAGDTLYKLSKMYGVRLIDILKENPYVNVYNLQPGDEMPTEHLIPGIRNHHPDSLRIHIILPFLEPTSYQSKLTIGR